MNLLQLKQFSTVLPVYITIHNENSHLPQLSFEHN